MFGQKFRWGCCWTFFSSRCRACNHLLMTEKVSHARHIPINIWCGTTSLARGFRRNNTNASTGDLCAEAPRLVNNAPNFAAEMTGCFFRLRS